MRKIRKVCKVNVGGLTLDGKKIYIQSMLNIPAEDVEGNVRQALELANAGCEIIRVAVPDTTAVRLIPAIKEKVDIPLVADIHFDYRIALECAAAGVDKIRINPGNIGSSDRVKNVVEACRVKNIPIRIGVNSGSLEKAVLEKYGSPTAEALAESAAVNAAMLEEFDFEDIVISIKSSNVKTMIDACRIAAERLPYPLHLGVTEAGTERMGMLKSAVGIGSLLCDGIGETIRVSLTDDPVKEVAAARDILKACGRGSGVTLVSCPTCGRTKIDLAGLAKKVERAVENISANITVAVMGCVVNGPGEAREADVGLAGGDGVALIFKKGEIVKKVREEEALRALMDEINKLAEL